MADSIIGGASLPESPNPRAEGQGTPKPNAGRVPAQKSLAALRKGAEACRVMLAAIEAHARIVCVPASDSEADMQAAYAPRYAGTDVAVAAALDQYAHDDGFRRAMGTYLLQVAEGAWDSPSATTADDLLTDGGNRSEPAPVEPAGGEDFTRARHKAETSQPHPAVDYLGHPCKIAAARIRFDEQLNEARKCANKDHRSIARLIGISINEIEDRMMQAGNGIEAALQALPNNEETDGARAILTMLQPYDIATSNKFGQLAGLVLVALEMGGLIDAEAEGAKS